MDTAESSRTAARDGEPHYAECAEGSGWELEVLKDFFRRRLAQMNADQQIQNVQLNFFDPCKSV
jgi:hypothetical protein